MALDTPEPFVCEDCGIFVHQFTLSSVSANDNLKLCLECEWLRTIEDVEERNALREVLRRT